MTDTGRVLQSAHTLRVILRMWEYESKIKKKAMGVREREADRGRKSEK